jgi:hypothetical protein
VLDLDGHLTSLWVALGSSRTGSPFAEPNDKKVSQDLRNAKSEIGAGLYALNTHPEGVLLLCVAVSFLKA